MKLDEATPSNQEIEMKGNSKGNFYAGEREMEGKREGMVTRNLLSLELQLKTLFEDCGGQDSLQLLDALSKLSKREQEVALKMFAAVCEKVARSEQRVISKEEESLKNFEDDLFESIVAEIQALPIRMKKSVTDLRVVDGGKTSSQKIIDLSEIRRSRTCFSPLETA
jgi:hypothetical protein